MMILWENSMRTWMDSSISGWPFWYSEMVEGQCFHISSTWCGRTWCLNNFWIWGLRTIRIRWNRWTGVSIQSKAEPWDGGSCHLHSGLVPRFRYVSVFQYVMKPELPLFNFTFADAEPDHLVTEFYSSRGTGRSDADGGNSSVPI
jgi:hypothetical protein